MLQIPRHLGSLMLIGFLSAVSSLGQSNAWEASRQSSK
jgi:hypothetical protein